MWQDWIFSIGQWCFSIALIPSIIGKSVIPISTSGLTAVVLTSFVVAFFTLNLTCSAWSTTVSALCWWILLVKAVLSKTHHHIH